MSRSAGYSATPLVRKLGLAPAGRVALCHAPTGFRRSLGRLPAGTTLVPHARGRFDVVILFHRARAELQREFPAWVPRIRPSGLLWVAWPKKAAKMDTDLSFDVVQRVGLDCGLVDTKICAIDETWSGLRFVRRSKDR